MASISYKEIEEKLKKLKDNPTSANEIDYILLDAFGMTKTSVERVRSGKMNLAHYEDGILVKKQLANRAVSSQKLTDTLEEMKADSKLLKQSSRILAVSDGTTLIATIRKKMKADSVMNLSPPTKNAWNTSSNYTKK